MIRPLTILQAAGMLCIFCASFLPQERGTKISGFQLWKYKLRRAH